MDSSVGRSEFTVIRIGDRYIGNWPAGVQQAIAVLTEYVEETLAAEANGADADAGRDPADHPRSGSVLRESAETAAKERSDAETAHPERFTSDDVDPRAACGAVEADPSTAIDTSPEIVLVRGRNAYESVSRLLG